MGREGCVRLFGNLGEGLKEGIEGIQEVGQIGRCEVTETPPQALVRRSGLLFWIPFHVSWTLKVNVYNQYSQVDKIFL